MIINRRKALKGVLSISGLSLVSLFSYEFFGKPEFYDREKLESFKELISQLVEVIIPSTSTPSAKESNVHEFIVHYMKDCASNREYINFLNGLKDLEQTVLERFNRRFIDCTQVQKIEILEKLEPKINESKIVLKISDKLRGRSFYRILKSLTIEGYCTSFNGATKHLIYAPVPGSYKAITNLTVDQKAWATK